MSKFDHEEFETEFLELTEELFGYDKMKFYTQKEWDEERGEKYGRGALLTAVIEESSWYHVLNGYYDAPDLVEDAMERLRELEEKFGIYHELGYAWSMHWYPA